MYVCTHQTAGIWELSRANDIMIMGNRAREVNIILKQIKFESEKYNLKLKHDKCIHIRTTGEANIHQKDGTDMETTDQVTYLGVVITPSTSRSAERSSGINKAPATCQK